MTHAVAERRGRRRVEHDLAALGVMLGLGKVVDERAGEHVDELDLRVADDEATRAADRHRDLQRQVDRGAGRGRDPPDPAHRLLHRDGGGDGPGPIVAVEPTGDRVAREVDDVSAPPVELLDDGVKDAADVGGELLGAALRAELGGECLGQRREARDVGEERRTGDAVRHRRVGGQGPPAVAGDVRLGVVATDLHGHGLHRPIVAGVRG